MKKDSKILENFHVGYPALAGGIRLIINTTEHMLLRCNNARQQYTQYDLKRNDAKSD